ncbi:MAG: hypothetical protein ABFS12_11365 [Bacteroidota bacterium]
MKKLIIISLLLFSGCDLFTNRDPEKPDSARSNYLPATTYDILFSNLKNSLQEKVLENYMACFVDQSFIGVPFVFYASSDAIAKFPTLNDWNLDSERQYFNNLINSTTPKTPIILNLQNEIKNAMGDSAVFQYDYILTLSPTNENIPSVFKGNLKFFIYLDSRNQWAIGRWEDIALDENPTWSELKGAMY